MGKAGIGTPEYMSPEQAEGSLDIDTRTDVYALAVTVLDEGGSALKDQPLVEARVRDTIGSTLLALGRYAEAEPNLRKSLEIFRAALPAGHPNIASGLSNFARAQQALGQTAQARAGFDEAIAMLRQGSPDGSPLLARILWRSGTARLEN